MKYNHEKYLLHHFFHILLVRSKSQVSTTPTKGEFYFPSLSLGFLKCKNGANNNNNTIILLRGINEILCGKLNKELNT